MRKIYLVLLLFSGLTSCLREDDFKKEFVTYRPVELNDGWAIADPASENIDPIALEQIYTDFHADDRLWQVRSLLVFRNGKLVAESYTKDESDRETPRAIWSQTKQVLSLLTGIAIDKGIIGGVDDSIAEYLPEMEDHPDKQAITIEHLLTMKSGISYSNDGIPGQTDDILMQLPDNITDFILSRPLADTPGEVSRYKDGDPQLLAACIENRCGKPLTQWATENLFHQLNIENLKWNKYRDSTTLGGFGILSTPREMAKFGQLVLDGGYWKGASIVSKAWIDKMTTERIADMYGFQFGYLWWIDKSRNVLMMNGHGGQYVVVVPDKKMMVVFTAEVNTQGDFQFRSQMEWVDRILEISK
jgi:CubicO group peptidase (beta-lactamase class C family)